MVISETKKWGSTSGIFNDLSWDSLQSKEKWVGYPRVRRTICMYLTYSMNIIFVKPEHHTYNYCDWLCRFSKWSKWQEEIIRVQEEHLSDPNIIPLTPKDVSVRVLKPRSGYVKELGMRPSFSLKIFYF